MENTIQTLKSPLDALETELHFIGREIARNWKSKKPGWLLVSEARR